MITLESARRRLEKARLPSDLLHKWDALVTSLESCAPTLVAFSGGVDSSFLAYCAHLVMGSRMMAVTVQSEVDPSGQVELACAFTQEHQIPQTTLTFDPLANPAFRNNPPDRCYYCKRDLLRLIWDFARTNGFSTVLEGQNLDDERDYRPGRKAVLETGTLSPLAANAITKADIRLFAKVLGLSIWSQPSSPCLASRFPYQTPITAQAVKKVDEAESYLHNWGFKEVRVRYKGGDACIEVSQEQIMELMVMRLAIVEAFKDIGFRTITIDLQGFRSGSLNEGINQ